MVLKKNFISAKNVFILFTALAPYSLTFAEDAKAPTPVEGQKDYWSEGKNLLRSIRNLWPWSKKNGTEGLDYVCESSADVKACLESGFLSSFERGVFLARGKSADTGEKYFDFFHKDKKDKKVDWEGVSTDLLTQTPSTELSNACTRLFCGLSPAKANPYGNFILGFGIKGGLPNSSTGGNVPNIIGTSLTARGFFGENSGPLRNIELVLQVGSDYSFDGGFETVDVQAFKKAESEQIVYKASRLVMSASASIGLFCQPLSNGFRTGVYLVGDPFFGIDKSEVYGLETDQKASQEAIFKFHQALGRFFEAKLKPIVKKKIQGALLEQEFFDGQIRIGSTFERQSYQHCNLEKPDLQSILQMYCIEPYLTGRLPENFFPGSILPRFAASIPVFLKQTPKEGWSVIGQTFRFAFGLSF